MELNLSGKTRYREIENGKQKKWSKPLKGLRSLSFSLDETTWVFGDLVQPGKGRCCPQTKYDLLNLAYDPGSVPLSNPKRTFSYPMLRVSTSQQSKKGTHKKH